MQFSDLPPELVEHILFYCAHGRSFSRAMRLRLVSWQFSSLMTDIVYRCNMLDHIVMSTDFHPLSMVNHAEASWKPLIRNYLTKRVLLEKNPRSPRGQLRALGKQLCGLVGAAAADEASLAAAVGELCSLTWYDGTKILVDDTCVKAMEPEPFRTYLVDAAVSLGSRPLVRHLLAQPGNGGGGNGGPGWNIGLLERRLQIAASHGDVAMMGLLLDAQPQLLQGREARLTVVTGTALVRYAAAGGHSEAFHWILDRTDALDLRSNLRKIHIGFLDRAMRWTAFPGDFERGAELFGPGHEVFGEGADGDASARLFCSARAGRRDMVRHFLGRGARLDHPYARVHRPALAWHERTWRRRGEHYRPLLPAVDRGDLGTLELLLDAGADPDWYPAEDTPLQLAAYRSDVAAAALLLDRGARPDAGSPPPLAIAARQECPAMVRLLWERGAAAAGPEPGAWGMAFARAFGLESMVDLLVQLGVPADSVLHRAEARDESARYSFTTRNYLCAA